MKGNKGLLVILGVLAVIFGFTHFFRNQNSSKVFQKKLVPFEVFEIDSVHIRWAKGQENPIFLFKKDDQWFVKSDSFLKKGDDTVVRNFIRELTKLNIDRLVSKDNQKWGKYNVSDSAGINLSIYPRGNKISLRIGKKEPKKGYFYESQTPFYIRVNDSKNVYLAKSILPTMISEDFNNWRDKTFIKNTRNNINRLSFEYDNDSFELIKKDTVWTINDTVVDSITVEDYLKGLSQNILEFGDDFTPTSKPNCLLKIYGDGLTSIEIKGFREDTDYYMESSLNPGNYSKTNKHKFKRLFTLKNHFLK